MPISEVSRKRIMYWIRVHGIPLEGFTNENILKIG